MQNGSHYVGTGIKHSLFPENSQSFQRHNLMITVNDFAVLNPSIIGGIDFSQWGNKISDEVKFAVMGLRDYFNIIRPQIYFPKIVLEVQQDQRKLTEWQVMMLSASSVQEMEKLPYFWRGMSLVKREVFVPKKKEVTFYNKKGEAKKITIESAKKIQGDLHKLYGDIDSRHKIVTIPEKTFRAESCEVRLTSYSGQNKIYGEFSKAENHKFLYREFNHDGHLNAPIEVIGVKIEPKFLARVKDNHKSLQRLGFVIDTASKKLGLGYQEFIDKFFHSREENFDGSIEDCIEMIKDFYTGEKNIDFGTANCIKAALEQIDSIRRFSVISINKFVELSDTLKANRRVFEAVKSDMRDIITELKDKKATKVRIQEMLPDGTYSASHYLMRLFDIAEKISKLRLVR